MSHKHKRKDKRQPEAGTGAGPLAVPSAQTFFHIMVRDAQAREVVERARGIVSPLLQLRDRGKVEQIRKAKDAVELLDLTSSATGLAEPVWYERIREFGPEIVPLLEERLKTLPSRGKEDGEYIEERLITALRWEGEPGARTLAEAFNSLDEYGKSLACVALGLLGHRPAADIIWQFYQEVAGEKQSYFVGALWGLIDLHDVRAADALLALPRSRRQFEELYPMLALAGDRRALGSLAKILMQKGEDAQDAGMALVCIADRLGKEAVVEEFTALASPGESRHDVQAAIKPLFDFPVETAHEYFSVYFKGFSLGDVKQAFLSRNPPVR